MARATVAERLRYGFDKTMARGTPALIGWLAVISLIFIGICALAIKLIGLNAAGETGSMAGDEAFWFTLMRTLDAGTVAGDLGSWPFRLMALFITMGGIFIVSTLIGILTSGVEARVEALRKGHSRVIEDDHTVILGWAPQIYLIVEQLIVANENRRGAAVVILGDADKVEMEDALRDRFPDTRGTRLICRSGSPMEPLDLDKVSVQTSRSIIVLTPTDDDPDAQVIKTILAITNSPQRRQAPYHIVAEIRDPANMVAAQLVGREEATLVMVGDLISRITVQTCRQNGLSVVYNDLLNFEGDELYFKAEPKLRGKTMREAQHSYEDSCVLGFKRQGKVHLLPPAETALEEGDVLICISEDDDTIHLTGYDPGRVQEAALQKGEPLPPHPERTLIIGWNWRVARIARGLEHYVEPGSELVVLSEHETPEETLAREIAQLKRQTIRFVQGDTTDRRVLDRIDAPSFHHVILLVSDAYEAQRADSRVLVTLLHLRDIAEKTGAHFTVVSEMLDIRNRTLAEIARSDDFIVSEQLVSLMMTQISEQKDLFSVFTELFDPEGAEIYLRPAAWYVREGEEVNFYTVIEAAIRRNEVAFGYKLKTAERNTQGGYGVVVNPSKSKPVRFGPGDKILVLALE